jgi:hypothetical protein
MITNQLLANAVIKPDGALPSDNERLLVSFVLEAGESKLWFRAQYKFRENQNDFDLEIGDFGLSKRVTRNRISFSVCLGRC